MVYFSRVVSNHENGKFAFGLLSTNRIITIIIRGNGKSFEQCESKSEI